MRIKKTTICSVYGNRLFNEQFSTSPKSVSEAETRGTLSYVAVNTDNHPCLLTIVSTMFGLELRSVLAAKNTSTMLW